MKKLRNSKLFTIPIILSLFIIMIFAFSSCGSGSGSDPVNQWPFFRGNAQGLGSKWLVDTSSTMDRVTWSTQFSDGYSYDENFISGAALAYDGSIYVASSEIDSLDNVELTKLDSSGNIIWQYPGSDPDANIAGTIHGSPVIDVNGIVYVGATDGYLYAINPDGTQKWRFNLGYETWAPAAIGIDGTIYIGTTNETVVTENVFYAINPEGTEKWNFPVNDIIRASANFSTDGTIYVRVYDGSLYALNADGTQKWLFKEAIGGSGATPVISSDGTIYIGDWESYSTSTLYAVNPDGTLKWDITVSGGIGATPIVGPDRTVYVATWGHYVHAVNPDGTEKWSSSDLVNYIQSSPALGSDGKLYAGTQHDAMLYALDTVDGSEVWNLNVCTDTGNISITAPLVIGYDGTVLVHCGDGKLYAIK